MIRNFLSGIVFGGVIAGLGLGVISQISPMPPHVGNVANSTMAPESSVEESADGTAAVDSAYDAGGKAATTVAADPIAADPVPVAPVEPDSLAQTPLAGADESTDQMATDQPETDPLASAKTESGQTANDAQQPEAQQPEAPQPEAPQPNVIDEAPTTPELPEAGMPAPEVASADDAAPMAAANIEKPDAPAAEQLQISADLPPAAPEEAQDDLLAPLPQTQAPQPAAEMALDAPAVDIPPAESALAEPAAELPVVLPAAKAPVVLVPAPGLAKTVDGVTTGRLPSIGKVDPAPATETAAADALDDPRPVAKFARAFTNDSGKPTFSIVLIDTAAADLDRAQLAAVGFPVTFVIDPLDPTAAEAMAVYRAAGQEVVMLASGIPRGANPSDLEQTFQANERVLPETVAVMDIGAGGFQDNRQLAAQVVPLIKDQGRGLLTFDRGLNAADQIARREAVPSAVIFRELDAADEATPLIRRYLDRAAFKAAQEGKVVVLGTTRPETIAALMEWAVEGRAASVTLAPLTAVLSKP